MVSETLGWFCAKNGVIHIYSFSPSNSLFENNITIGVNVFPNPFTNTTTIRFTEGGMHTYSMELSNLKGKVIKSWNVQNQNEISIIINGVSPGYYLLNIVNEENLSATKRLIIK